MAVLSIWNRVTGAIAGFAIGRAASDATKPIFEVLRQDAWNANPNAIIGSQVLASLVATGALDFDPAAEQARREGLNANQFRALVEYFTNAPQLGMALQALQRGTITEAQYRTALAKAGIADEYHDAMVNLRHALVPQSDLVRMAVREVFSPGQRDALDLDAEFPDAFADRAEDIGLSRSIARDYWAAHWELPSYTQLTEMRFRKLLSPEAYRDALKAIDIAPTWREKMFEIARRIPTVTDMIRFAVREVYDDAARATLGIDAEYPDEFTAQAALHGMSEAHARQYWAAHWRLPSARQGYQMVWRGEMELPELKTLLKALDYPPKWRDRLFNIAFVVPGRIDLKRMLRHGIKTLPQVVEGYEKIGYSPADAVLMGEVARRELLGSATSSPWLNRARSRLFTVTHAEYLDGSIDEGRARALLTEIGAAAVEIDPIIELWNAEESIGRTELTVAQIRKAYKKTVFSRDEALGRLLDKGIAVEDANVLLDTT